LFSLALIDDKRALLLHMKGAQELCLAVEVDLENLQILIGRVRGQLFENGLLRLAGRAPGGAYTKSL
jgi:hypothetical protein